MKGTLYDAGLKTNRESTSGHSGISCNIRIVAGKKVEGHPTVFLVIGGLTVQLKGSIVGVIGGMVVIFVIISLKLGKEGKAFGITKGSENL
jgi:hypothetical protein